MSEAITGSWAAEALVASTLLMVTVLALRLPAQRVFGARIAYALWALPGLRLILPRMPGWDVDRFRVAVTVEPSAPATPIDPSLLASLPPADAAPAIDWAPLLLALWLGGAAAYFLWQIGVHRRFLDRLLQGSQVRRRDLGVEIVAGPAIPGPLAAGLVRRKILLPADFTTRYTPRERRLVLAHEMAHHARGDLHANLAALVILSLHWFNPLAHIAYRAFRADQELACDETVLATAAPDAPGWYGQAVVKSAAPRFPAAACAMHGLGLVKRRLRMMGRAPAGTVRTLAGTAIGTALVTGGLVLTASGGHAQEAASTPAPVAVPAPPAPPAVGPETRRHRHVYVDRHRTIVDGRVVDEKSAEGKRLRAEARVAGDAARAAGARARIAGREAAQAGRRAAAAARTAWADMPPPPAAPAPPAAFAPPVPPPPAVMFRHGRAPIDGAALERTIEQAIDEQALERDIERGLRAAGRTRTQVAMIDGRTIAIQARVAATHGLAQARIGLRHARAAIAGADMPEDARTSALATIDREIARLDAER